MDKLAKRSKNLCDFNPIYHYNIVKFVCVINKFCDKLAGMASYRSSPRVRFTIYYVDS